MLTCEALEKSKQLTVNSANANFMPTKSKQLLRLTAESSKPQKPAGTHTNALQSLKNAETNL